MFARALIKMKCAWKKLYGNFQRKKNFNSKETLAHAWHERRGGDVLEVRGLSGRLPTGER